MQLRIFGIDKCVQGRGAMALVCALQDGRQVKVLAMRDKVQELPTGGRVLDRGRRYDHREQQTQYIGGDVSLALLDLRVGSVPAY